MKKILITGAGGFVGSRIVQQLHTQYELVQIPKHLIRAADCDGIVSAVSELQPNFIIHTAAISDTGYSQDHPEESYIANVCLPVCMAKAARTAGAKLISFSSDQVYNGESGIGPFSEETDVHPTNVYGQHKLEAENRMLDISPDSVHLRATWMYDLPGYGLPIRGNFVLNLVQSAIAGRETAFPANDYRGITYVRSVVDMLVPALDLPGGVYNFGSENALNMLDTAVEFSKALGLNISIGRSDRTTARSLSMNCEKIKKFGIVFDDTQAGIYRCLKDYGVDS